MQESVKRYAEEVRRAHGVNVQIRVGLNSGEVVVRAIGSDPSRVTARMDRRPGH
jgi:adenylate cyclase